MTGIRQTWTTETYFSFLASVEHQRHQKIREQVANRKNGEDVPSAWFRGRIEAEMLIANEPESIPFRLDNFRRQREALKEFHYGDPEKAHLKIEYEDCYLKEELEGKIAKLELWCKKQGLHVPTQEEREEAAISRLVEQGALA